MAQRQVVYTHGRVRNALVAIAAAAGIAGFSGGIAADTDLSGSWSGGGSVSFASGSTEKARCRATYAKAGGGYKVNATCATASGKVAQTASVKRSGPATFSGSFFNSEYNTEGSIYVSVNGNSQNVTLTSAVANASLRLSR